WRPLTRALTATPSVCTASDAAAKGIHPLPLHDALPIDGQRPEVLQGRGRRPGGRVVIGVAPDQHPVLHLQQRTRRVLERGQPGGDRKSTRLNSSHVSISYAVLCLKKKRAGTAWGEG